MFWLQKGKVEYNIYTDIKNFGQDHCKKQILLSVVVSCKGLLKNLKKNLLALSRQNLDQEFWDAIFIFKEEQKHSDCIFLIKDYFPSSKFLFLPKGKPLYEMRNLSFQHISSPYIYFIDEDVILNDPRHLNLLIELHKRFPKVTVIGGSYLDHPDCTFLGRSYNWIARLWTKNQKNFVPAGNLSIKTNKTFQARFYSPGKFDFGGEEVYFLQAIGSEGHQSLWQTELDANHLAFHSFKDFVKRAWFHGSSLAFEQKTRKISYLLFLREPAPFLIKMSALFYLFLVRLSCFFYTLATKRG